MSVHAGSSPKADGRERRAYLRKEERREQILEAALTCFTEGGYHGTHVAAVVERAGVARGTFYLHFQSKHDVFEALVDRMLGVFLELPREDWGRSATLEEAREVLENAYRRTFATFRENRHLCRLLFEEAVGIDKGFRERLEGHYAAWSARIQEMLVELQASEVARADLDREVTAELVIGMVERITRRYLLDEQEPDIEALVAKVVTFELQGVKR